MEFQLIEESSKIFPGEYLLHKPTSQIVMCGAYKKRHGIIKALVNGKLMEDKVENFRKILLNKEERTSGIKRKGCGGCKKR